MIETLRTLIASGITHVTGIPDNTSAALFDALADHERIRLVTVTREGEAFAVASGLWLGGASPLVVIQNTGLLEAGDALRGTAVRMGAAIPIVVTGRGYEKMERAGLTPEEPRSGELLTRAAVDSTALLTEPTLEAWGIPFRRCEGDDDPAVMVGGVIAAAREHERPAAVVVARAFN